MFQLQIIFVLSIFETFVAIEEHHRCFRLGSYFMATVLADAR